MWISLLAIASISCALYIVGVALPNWTEFELFYTSPTSRTIVSRNTGLFTSCFEVGTAGTLYPQTFYI